MPLPPCCKEWIKLIHPNIALTENKEKLIIQLFNACQGSVDAGQKLNKLFDKVLGKMSITRSLTDFVVHDRRIDGDLLMLNVSIDDVLVYTASPIMQSKVVIHLRNYFPSQKKKVQWHRI